MFADGEELQIEYNKTGMFKVSNTSNSIPMADYLLIPCLALA